MGFREGRWHLVDLFRKQMDFPELKATVLSSARQWNADGIIIEYAGSGIPLLQQLRADSRGNRLNLKPIKPRLDKQTRLEAQTARLATGKYVVLIEAPWLADFRRELQAFPKSKHDDQVDSMVQFLEWSSSPHGQGFLDRDPETKRPIGSIRNRPPRL